MFTGAHRALDYSVFMQINPELGIVVVVVVLVVVVVVVVV
jgi:hypothetical protein